MNTTTMNPRTTPLLPFNLDLQLPMLAGSRTSQLNELRRNTFLLGDRMTDLTPRSWTAFDLKETGQAYVIHADVPGMNLKDLDIRLLGNRIILQGNRTLDQDENEDLYHFSERCSGSFTRTITLPEPLEAGSVDAHLVDGVLSLTVVKGSSLKAQTVKVKAGH